ncbi:FCD domain-containing protein [Streptomyces lunaelactis]|uniref:FCD domain-containing protein n=1 Tax=Streptomyces lunaelactis TaxID=1535768 RepID=UPI002814B1D8|nr:FCD domain-containing protein [Streptomyces lunaelactis]
MCSTPPTPSPEASSCEPPHGTAVRAAGSTRRRTQQGLPLLEESAEEHHELLDALLARDEEAVRAVMTRHLGHVRDLWAK